MKSNELKTRINNPSQEIENEGIRVLQNNIMKFIPIHKEIYDLEYEEQYEYYKQGDNFPSDPYQELLYRMILNKNVYEELKNRYNKMKEDLIILQELLKEKE